MNKKLVVKFTYDGKMYKFVGYFTSNMRYPLEIEENEECISVDNYNDYGYLSISFERDGYIFEIEFEYDDEYNVDYESPKCMIIWGGDDNSCIIDDMLGEDVEVTMSGTTKRQPTRYKR